MRFQHLLGKLLPADYSLLYFIKPGGTPKVNLGEGLIDSRDYCLRNSCIVKRKKQGDDKIELSNWIFGKTYS